jgi:hypothetical protein
VYIGNWVYDSGGGGVYVTGSSTFTMKGGEISGNTAYLGGGVDIGRFGSSGTFIMEGGKISGNTASSSGNGGGVYVTSNSTFTMKGGEISGNTAYAGGGVCNGDNGTFTKTGGTIYGDTDTTHMAGSTENTAASGAGHAVFSSGSKKRNSTAGAGVNLDSAMAENWE